MKIFPFFFNLFFYSVSIIFKLFKASEAKLYEFIQTIQSNQA